MTVRITKPAFNLREKITELDFDRVPYEKIPVGSVVQVKKDQLYGNGQVNTTSGSFQDSGLFIDFYPKFANSRLLIEPHFNASTGSASASGLEWTVYRQIDGTATSSSFNVMGSSDLGRNIAYTSPSGYMHESGASTILDDKPQTIKKVQYRLFFRSHNGSTNVGVARNWGGAHIKVTEVRE